MNLSYSGAFMNSEALTKYAKMAEVRVWKYFSDELISYHQNYKEIALAVGNTGNIRQL